MRELAAAALAAALTACTVGPRYEEPDTPMPGRFDQATDESAAEEVGAGLWAGFGSTELDELIARALEANTTIAQANARLAENRCPDVHSVAQAERERGSHGEAGGTKHDRLPPFERAERAECGAHDREPAGGRLDHDDAALAIRREALEVDACGDDRVVAGEARRRPLGDVLARRDQSVDTRQESVSLIPARGVAEPLRIDERRDGRRLRCEERLVGEPRDGRVEPVDEVEAAAAERRRDVRADADGQTDRGPRRDGNCARDRDDPLQLAGLERAPPGE